MIQVSSPPPPPCWPQLLDEANKVEEAVRRLGSFRGSDKQEGKEQYEDKYKEEEKVEVVVSKSEAVLLCSFFKDRARLPFPEYCESEEGALGKEKDGQEAFKKNDDRHQEGKRDTGVDVETLAVKKDSTKLINNPQLAEVVHVDNVVGPKRQRQQPMTSHDPSNQWDSVSNMLRTFGFQRFLYPAQRHKNFMGSPYGFQQASSPAWYPAQPQTSPYDAFMSNLHLQRLPHQHLHIHMSQGMGSDLTNQEENVKSRKKAEQHAAMAIQGLAVKLQPRHPSAQLPVQPSQPWLQPAHFAQPGLPAALPCQPSAPSLAAHSSWQRPQV